MAVDLCLAVMGLSGVTGRCWPRTIFPVVRMNRVDRIDRIDIEVIDCAALGHVAGRKELADRLIQDSLAGQQVAFVIFSLRPALDRQPGGCFGGIGVGDLWNANNGRHTLSTLSRCVRSRQRSSSQSQPAIVRSGRSNTRAG